MIRTWPAVIAFVALVLAGVVPGILTGRWGVGGRPAELAGRLALVPSVVGEWEGRSLDAAPRELEATGATGLIQREFTHRGTGQRVAVSLLCGRPGPLAVHTPEVCYDGSGFKEVGSAVRTKVPGGEVRVRQFHKAAAVPVTLRVIYGWSAGGSWEAPENPRLHFAGRPALAKLYVVREMGRADEPLAGDPALDFLKVAAEPFRLALFPGP